MIEPTVMEALRGFLERDYPGIEIRAEPYSEDPSRTAISFRHALFSGLYPMQRYHYLAHLIPGDFIETHLAGTVWYELAPGETADDLEYPDPELIESIEPHVMRALEGSGFLRALDLEFSPELPSTPAAQCHGDFRVSKPLLLKHGFTPEELFEIFHVLMARGGNCDCEILYNAVEESRLKASYWRARAREQGLDNLHARPDK